MRGQTGQQALERGQPQRALSRLGKTLRLLGCALALFSAARLYLYLDNRALFAQLEPAELAEAVLFGLRFDLAAIAMVLLLPVGLMHLPAVVRPFGSRGWFTAWAWVGLALTGLMVAVLVADVNFVFYLGRHLAFDWDLLAQDTNPAQLRRHALAVALALGGVLAAALVWRAVLRRPERPPGSLGQQCLVWALLLGGLLAAARGHLASGAPMGVIDAFRAGSEAQANLALNGVFTALHGAYAALGGLVRQHGAAQALRAVRDWLPEGEPDYPFCRRHHGPALVRNVVVIALESWDPEAIGALGATPSATPHFDALAAGGVLFSRCYAVGTTSTDALVAAFAGLPQLPGTARLGRGPSSMSRASRFGHLARTRGYATALAHPAPARAWRHDAVAAMLGFEHYWSGESVPLRRSYPDPTSSKTGWDYDLFLFALQRLQALPEPFALALLTGTTHEPFPDPGPPFRAAPAHRPMSREAYLATLRYADWALGEFMRQAREQPWFPHTAFVLFGDHAVRGLDGHGTRGRTFEQRYRVPLLLYAPGRLAARRDDRICSQLDVLPTLIELLGFDTPYAALGSSLLGPPPGWALIGGRGTVGLVRAQGYVLHDLRGRREAGGSTDPAELDRLEQQLLLLDAAAYHALRLNRWLPEQQP
ncbi:MAG: hypothetical protein KatS3mg102_1557 [Planctomycetota bacterium]|nr:MAG: hypothetical protein KatS3mg102_1557 [Planctomycetota bacterium]